ncbi:uncharacterized protein LOC107776329 isoform X3 [Nicotiana tabacum]|uniref:Serine/threonine-protein phosphatase 4 regulatory subunit 2 isoform X3 n=2 Tax=Nicotiana TaxID=4085 RepID=A0A1S3YHV5_TOBAC|nr:PREDICTED: serine/threonine-protein phosphatase 4 regulatory subunit 2 isoform X3 [Nicotiana sylvestris]XP_016451700.1 PREDICTED: serine/threonine-protein phosphatase 4 regulatory subunit 2-like isoform X3 [Nicotiana tabacum]
MGSPQPGMESEKEINDDEVKNVIDVMAANGKYWHDWDKLKGMLSFHLKQVWGALNSFAEGPPFTLQRLCEILLDARNIYSKLSKLALALEKNLLVTSTLTISSDPNASSNMQNATAPDREETNGAPILSNSVSNGVEPIASAGDSDEVMTEVEEAEVEDVMTIDMDTIEAIVRSSEADTTPPSDS